MAYNYNATAGNGVDVYILDTGIYTAHSDFSSAKFLKAFGGYDMKDGNGHGTFCAGLVGGTKYVSHTSLSFLDRSSSLNKGVAKKARLFGSRLILTSFCA